MVLGYDELRPKKENYLDFLDKFVKGLEKIGNKDIGLMIYGSFIRGDSDFGRSDIDAVLVFPEVITDKKLVNQIAYSISDAQKGNNLPLEITPVDLTTMSDGRFNSYDPSFEKYFKSEGKIIFGLDYRNKFTFEFPTMPDQGQITANLWKSRRALLMSELNLQKDYKKFLEEFEETLNKTSRASKQIIGLTDGNLRLNRFSALEEISQIFPQVDITPLKKIKYLYKNLKELDEVYKHPGEVLKIWNSSLTFFEEMIKAYLDANQRTRQ